METIRDIIAEMREFAVIDAHTIGRDVLRRRIQHFARRIDEAVTNCNQIKMRESLNRIHMLLWDYLREKILVESLCRIIEKEIDTALSVPPRNCDVGTAEEQYRRWRIFCDSTSCNSCPCQSEYEPSAVCFCRWAQMPYESEVSND